MSHTALLWKVGMTAVLEPLLLAAILFTAAGTVRWWPAWVLVAVFLVGTLASTLGILNADPELLAQRFAPPVQAGQPLADKIVLLAMLASFVAELVLGPVDAVRLHLLPAPSPLIARLGLPILVGGWWIVYLGLRENAFAIPVVKLQADRAQVVVDSGPYAIVRHPMYAGGLLFFFGTGLWLESYAATLLAIVPSLLLVVRVRLEESLLATHLPGYAAYCARVKYRLIPFVW